MKRMFRSNVDRFIFSNGSETSAASAGRLATSVGAPIDASLLGLSDVSPEPTNAAEGNEGPLAAQAESIAASVTPTARSTMESNTLINPTPFWGL
ncbi:MAG: hypothetical protein WB713_06630 [Methyloceanibacter sp.]